MQINFTKLNEDAHRVEVLRADGTSDAVTLAEKLAGPVQTLLRKEAEPDAYLALLQRVVPDVASEALARRIHAHARRLAGHWKGTPFGSVMRIRWGE